MSSAILYLAIVAIWACVLIPRWLRRDTARGAAVPAPLAPSAESGAEGTDDGTAEYAGPTTRTTPAGSGCRRSTSRSPPRKRGGGCSRHAAACCSCSPASKSRPSRWRASAWPPSGWSSRPRSCSAGTCCCSARPRRPTPSTRSGPPGRHAGQGPRPGTERPGTADHPGRRHVHRGHPGGSRSPGRQVRRRPGPGRLRGRRPRLRPRPGGQVHHLERRTPSRPTRTIPQTRTTTSPSSRPGCAPSATSRAPLHRRRCAKRRQSLVVY